MPRMTRAAWPALAMAALLMAFQSTPVRAEFGDCTEASYLRRFDDRVGGMSFTCEERLRERVGTEAGERHIRLLHDRHAGWAASPGVFREYERGIREAARALGQIGPFRMDDVTVLLIDGLPPRDRNGPDGFSNIAGDTHVEDDECLIAVYLLASREATANAAFSIAHEIFHCVQLGTLSAAQMASGSAGTGSGGDWWLEGSAEWFAARAIPDARLLSDRAADFDRRSPDTPLYEMAYEAVVFFLWLDGERGPQSILPFLRRMAGSSAASAQRSALQGALGADQWLAFAQAYLDRDIRRPNGSALPLNPSEGDTWRWTRTRTETITLEPFVLRRGRIEFGCGEWTTEVRPDESYAVRADGGSWGDLPDRIDANDGDESRFRFVGLAARRSDLRLAVRGDLEAGCRPCGGSDAIDECLVGRWQETGGGPIEWMQRVLRRPRVVEGERRNVVVVYESDGTFATGPVAADLTTIAETDEGEVRGDSQAVWQTTGRWSAEGGRLSRCVDRSRFQGDMTITSPDGETFHSRLPVPRTTGPEVVRYTCSETSLETTLTFPGVPQPMATQYSRIGGGSE